MENTKSYFAPLNVYGLGNALVDMEYQVDERFLQKMNVPKGTMTLVEPKDHERFFEELSNSHVTRASGGSAANTLISLAQFGGKGFYSCKVSEDEWGEFYLKGLQEIGVETNPQMMVKEEKLGTGKCLILITPDADRTMQTCLGISQTFDQNQILEAEIKRAQYIYVEGYLVATENGRQAMKFAKDCARKHGVKVALSCSDPAMVEFFRPHLMDFIADGVDLLFCNEKEAKSFWPGENMDVIQERMKKFAQKFVITLGAKGATIFDGTQFISIEGFPVKAIDTTGAGDMFAGAFLYGHTHGYSPLESGKLASYCASKVVSQLGPRLTLEKAQEALKEFKELKF
jgi:sugar/nucleoside kinase (ribokinase family)